MLLSAEEHAPQARCGTCGSPGIVSVCHHCGTCLCQKHSRRAADAAGRPVSREFDGLGFDGKQVGVYHCAEHDHTVQGGLLIVVLIGACVAIAGAFVLIASIPAGLALLVAGAGVAIGFYLAHRRRLAAARMVRPALPVVPIWDLVSVQETIRGEIDLAADGTYTSVAAPAEGAVAVVMTLTRPDRERLSAYRAKYALAPDGPVEFSAGFAVLSGEVGLTYEPGHLEENRLVPGSTGLAFSGVVSGHPLFSTGRGRSAGQWTIRFPYRLHRGRAPRSIPLWIVPSLVPGSDRRILQVELDWAAFGAPRYKDVRRYLEFLQFEVIELDVPTDWGDVQRVEPAANAVISEHETGPTQTIQWRLLSPALHDGTERTILKIRFEKRIGETDTVTGRLRASFTGSLSGITGARMYWPTGGGSPQQPEVSVAVEVQVKFSLSLNAVRYQAVRVIPDGDSDLSRASVDEIPRVIPDHRTVIALTNKLSRWGYYVKRVTGHPPRDGGHANLANRVWDIAGREYKGVFPVDFHITLTGEEEYRCGGIHSTAGNSTARLAVRGSYVDEGMRMAVETVWEELHERVLKELSAQQGFAPGGDGESPGEGWMPPPAGPPPWQ
jgi:hypothetical protein